MRTAHSLGAHTAETTFYTPFANLLNTVGILLMSPRSTAATPRSYPEPVACPSSLNHLNAAGRT